VAEFATRHKELWRQNLDLNAVAKFGSGTGNSKSQSIVAKWLEFNLVNYLLVNILGNLNLCYNRLIHLNKDSYQNCTNLHNFMI